jgi:hypothetical protein
LRKTLIVVTYTDLNGEVVIVDLVSDDEEAVGTNAARNATPQAEVNVLSD